MVLVFSRRSPGSSTMMPGRPPRAPSWWVQTRSGSLQGSSMTFATSLICSTSARSGPRSYLAAILTRARLRASRSHTAPDREPTAIAPGRHIGQPVPVAVVDDGTAIAGQQRVDGVRPRERRRMLDGVAAHLSGAAVQQFADRLRP